MNIDTPLPQVPIAALSAGPARSQSEQTSARPVDRPHHDEPIGNRPAPQTAPAPRPEGQTNEPAPETGSLQPESRLSAEQPHSSDAQASDASDEKHSAAPSQQASAPADPTRPSSVGELLDVIA